ncbi:MAG TPA: hypothetical protein VH107_17080, partial [Lacipirellulaceae bacterium]|nr:hypothetical protein [Lacipirellulaceae bacterium]
FEAFFIPVELANRVDQVRGHGRDSFLRISRNVVLIWQVRVVPATPSITAVPAGVTRGNRNV